MEKIFGNAISTTTLSVTVKITRSICDTSTRTLCVGTTMNYIQKNREMNKKDGRLTVLFQFYLT